jgi:hypothetical protein
MDIKICGTEGHSFLVENVMESSGAASKTTGLVVVEANNKARYLQTLLQEVDRLFLQERR